MVRARRTCTNNDKEHNTFKPLSSIMQLLYRDCIVHSEVEGEGGGMGGYTNV